MLLKDKVAIVTGGTRGIGFAIVKAYLDEGAKVIFTGTREETVNKALDRLKESHPDSVYEGIYPNLNDLKELKKAFRDIKERYGSIDILANNAGVSASEEFKDYDQEMFERVIEVNIIDVFNCSRAVYDIMAEQRSGVIISTSSMVSRDGQAAGIAYPTSKFAINGFTLSLARELAPLGIRVNAVAPGITNTDMVSALPDEMIKPLIDTIPLGRLGEPEDIANAYVFLASDKGSYISGQIIYVDGLKRV